MPGGRTRGEDRMLPPKQWEQCFPGLTVQPASQSSRFRDLSDTWPPPPCTQHRASHRVSSDWAFFTSFGLNGPHRRPVSGRPRQPGTQPLTWQEGLL